MLKRKILTYLKGNLKAEKTIKRWKNMKILKKFENYFYKTLNDLLLKLINIQLLKLRVKTKKLYLKGRVKVSIKGISINCHLNKTIEANMHDSC